MKGRQKDLDQNFLRQSQNKYDGLMDEEDEILSKEEEQHEEENTPNKENQDEKKKLNMYNVDNILIEILKEEIG